jgi:hypothetical protein
VGSSATSKAETVITDSTVSQKFEVCQGANRLVVIRTKEIRNEEEDSEGDSDDTLAECDENGSGDESVEAAVQCFDRCRCG